MKRRCVLSIDRKGLVAEALSVSMTASGDLA
jgi:hypothetical protein